MFASLMKSIIKFNELSVFGRISDVGNLMDKFIHVHVVFILTVAIGSQHVWQAGNRLVRTGNTHVQTCIIGTLDPNEQVDDQNQRTPFLLQGSSSKIVQNIMFIEFAIGGLKRKFKRLSFIFTD